MEKKDQAPLNVRKTSKAVMPVYTPFLPELEELVAAHPYKFYALLLGRDDDAFLSDYMAKKWKNMHCLSGNDCLFLSVYAPGETDGEILSYWKGKLGDEFADIFNKIPDPDWSYEYARNLGIPFEKLPCLFLGTSLQGKSGFVIKIPQWSEKDLTSLFEFIFGKMNDAAQLSENERLQKMEEEIDRYYALKLGGIYTKNHWMEYVNLKEIAQTVVEILIGGVMAGLKNKIGVK